MANKASIDEELKMMEKEINESSVVAEGYQTIIKKNAAPVPTLQGGVSSSPRNVPKHGQSLTDDDDYAAGQETCATPRGKSSGHHKSDRRRTASGAKKPSSDGKMPRRMPFIMSHILAAVCGCLAAYLTLKVNPQFPARGRSPTVSCGRSLLPAFTTLAPSTNNWKVHFNAVTDVLEDDLVTSDRLQPLSIVFACSKRCDLTNLVLSSLNGTRECILDLAGEQISGGGEFGDQVVGFLSRQPDGIILIRNMEKAPVSLVNKLADALSDVGSIRGDKSVATGRATFILTTEVPERLFNEGVKPGGSMYDFGDKVKTHLLKAVGAIKEGEDENSVSLRRRLLYIFPARE